MGEVGKETLGLPPMELAEYTTAGPAAAAAERASSLRRLCCKCFVMLSSKRCQILTCIGVVIMSSILLWKLYPRNENFTDVQKTQILIVTGTRQPINETLPATDMTVFLEIKDKNNYTTVTRSKRSNKRSLSETRINSTVNKYKFDMVKAREVILNHNEICDPENINDFCKKILHQLNISITDENDDVKQEVRKFRDTDAEETLVTSDSGDKRPTGILKSQFHDSSMNGVDLRDESDYISNTENYNHQLYPHLHQNPIHMGTSGYPQYPSDCLLTRLLNQYNTAPTMNLYALQRNPYYLPANSYSAPSGFPYTSPGIINPYLQNGPYASSVWPSTREAAATGLDQSRHPQDVGISLNYKDSLPSPSVESRRTFRLGGCPAGAAPCAADDVCVEGRRWCDGRVDCADGSDEAGCSCRERVDASRLCDGYYDCPFGEDEMGCFGCGEQAFSCDDVDLNSKSSCFEKEQRCDNVVHCSNRKDEVECNMLAPSLYEKPIFAVSHTEGFLHRNYRGKWYPVCENPYMWAHDACRRETGLMIRPPFIQMIHVDPLFKGSYINNMHGDLQMTDSCANSSAIYITCQDLLCGTRVQTTTQTLRENADYENRLFGRNKRSVDSARISLARNKATVKAEVPQLSRQPNTHTTNRELKDISETIPPSLPEENSVLEIWKYLTQIKLSADDRRRANRTKRGFSSGFDGRGKRAESRVVGGRPSEPAAWPWMVAIYKDGVFHCGGVIVSNRWILSAAHCVHVFWDHYYEVQVGMLRRFSFSPQEQNHKVTHVIVNQRYSRSDMRNDLSLLRVAPALQYSRWVRPVCLPAQHTAGPAWAWGPPPGTKCVAVGWGATVEHGPDPDHMREVEVPVWNRCKHREDQAGREICAGLIEGGRDACQGDSGGPLLCKNPLNSRQWYMAGIVSHGDGCGRKGEPGVYTRVSLYVDWIHFHILSLNLPTIRPKQDCPGFRCVSGISKCLPKKRLCDKIVDCLNAEDEIRCPLMRTADESDTTASLSTTQIQNETQVQSTKTGETTSFSDITVVQENKIQTTPDYYHKYYVNKTYNFSRNKKILNHTQLETPQTLHRPISIFQKDTEDLLSYHSRTSHYTTTETVHTSNDSHLRSSDITTEANLIPEERFDIENVARQSGFKVASAMSDLNKIKPLDSEITHSRKAEMSQNSLSSQDFANQNSLIETSTLKTTQDITTTRSMVINSNDNEITKVSDETSHAPEAFIDVPNNTSDDSESHGNSLIEDDSSNDKKIKPLPNDSIVNDQDTIKIHPNFEDKDISSHIIDETVLPEKTDKFEGSGNNLENNSNENIQTEFPEQIQNKGIGNIVKPTDLPQFSFNNATQVSQGDNKTMIVDQSPIPDQFTDQPKDLSIGGGKKEVKKITVDQHISLIDAQAKKKISILPFFECNRMSQIIQSNLRCNHQADCEDGTDEIECTCVDYLTTFNSNLLCDGVLDCADGLDEVGCYECGLEQFLCKWSKMCLPNEYVCDGIAHCPKGEDELDCYALTEGEFVMYDIDGRPHVNTQGYLTMKQQNHWNVVCEENFQKIHQEEAANHICHYLGFSGHMALKTKYVNIPYEDQLRAANETKSKRSIKSEKINYTYKLRDANSDNEKSLQGDIHNPVVLPIECVPNVVRTCMILYVTCVPTLNSDLSSHQLIPSPSQASHSTKSAYDILERSNEYLWPWAANVYVEGEYKCTGVLIDLNWVLVSDSCLWDTLLSKDYVCVVLGNKRTLAATSGPFEQILEVDVKKDLSDSHVTLLHLRQHANFTRMVKPMVPPSFNVHGTGSSACVAVGRGSGGRSVTVLLQEVDGSCGRRKMCFERRDPAPPPCQQQSSTGTPWAGIISCRVGAGAGGGGGGGGWFPAASFKQARGECGFRGLVAADSLAHLRTHINDTIASGAPQPAAATEATSCRGVRCARGACVPLAHACDGVRHCEDGADELEAACKHKNAFCKLEPLDSGCRCSSDQLKCHSGRCISKDLFANGRNDCGDGSDEPRLATCAQYLARVAPHRLCDGRLHCQDRSDEDPAYCKCFSLNTERCPKSDSCVARDMVCDGVRDCPHGEDETACTALAAPEGTEYGTGEVIVRQFGVWHTKCYHTPNHTRSELEKICRDLGFISGHAELVRTTVLPSINPNTDFVLDKFTEVSLNRQTSILLRSNDKPMARAVVDKTIEDCYPVYIECL